MTVAQEIKLIESRYQSCAHAIIECDRKAKPKYEPYPHQRATWSALDDAERPRRGIIALPTGAGKTYTAIHWLATEVLSEPKPRAVLWIAHRAELLQQAAEELVKCRGLCNRDQPLEMRCISGMHGKPISTLIASADVTFVTIQSLSRRPDLVETFFKKHSDSVVVVDEAHHSAAKTYREVLKTAKRRRDVEIIGLTATPTRTILEEVSYLNKIFTSGILHQVSLVELIENGILSIPYCDTVKTNQSFDREFTAKELQHLYKFGDLPPSMLKKIGQSTSRNKLIVQHYLDYQRKYGKTIVFATNIAHCFSLSEMFKSEGISSDYIASQRHDNRSNDAVLEKYRNGDISVLIGVDMLTEGIDVPKTASVFLTRPTGSEILMRQMVGRALRGPKAGGLKEAYIVSFADHWERFPGWLDPIQLIYNGSVPDEPVPPEKGPLFPIHIPWELIREISLLAPNIEPSQVLCSLPLGWYKLRASNPETGNATAILVYDHQKAAFDQFIIDCAKGYDPFLGRGGALRNYFHDIQDPLPTIQQLKVLEAYISEFGKPKYISFVERDEFDPTIIAEETRSLSPDKIRKKAVDIYNSTMAAKLYNSASEYVDAVFDELRRLMSGDQPAPIDEFNGQKAKNRRPPPYKKWSLKRLMDGICEEMNYNKEPLPKIRWSERFLKRSWAFYRETDNVIVINKFLQTDAIKRRTMEFLIYHELLHHRLGVAEGHSKYFRELERLFPGYAEADADLDTYTERYGPPRMIIEYDGSIRD